MNSRPVVGGKVKRRYVTEELTIVAVDENIVLKNEFGWYSTTRFEAWDKHFVEVKSDG